MLNLLLETSGGANANAGNGSWWIYLVLIGLVVVMLVLPSITNKKRMKEYNQMLDQLRVGDEVRTIGGVVGRVTKINTKGELKTFVLETGAKGSKTTMEFDMAAVGTVLKSTYVAPTEAKEKKEEKEAEIKETEEVKEEKVALVDGEPVKEETESKPKKTAAKKTATKKTTKK